MLSYTQYKIKKSTALVFFAAILVQVFHMLEHFAQIHQHAILGLSIKDSVGLLPFLNLEYVHWFYNLAYLILLGIVFKECRFFTLKDRTNSQKVAIILFGLGFFLQGYHVIEHTVRMSQYHIAGCIPCVGILGSYFDGVYLHFVFNFLVFVYPLGAFFMFGFYKKILFN